MGLREFAQAFVGAALARLENRLCFKYLQYLKQQALSMEAFEWPMTKGGKPVGQPLHRSRKCAW